MQRLVKSWRAGLPEIASIVAIEPPYGPPVGALCRPLQHFLQGESDFALLTREIAEADIGTFRASHRGLAPRIVPIAAGNWNRFGYTDAVVFVVHPDNPLRSLSFAQIDAVLSTTRLRGLAAATVWGDLGSRGAWRDRPIEVVGGGAWAAEESARALTVRRKVLSFRGKQGAWLQRPGTGGDGDVVEQVSQRPAALGFTGRGHVRQTKVLAISANDGTPVSLTEETARSGAYPLLRTVDLIIPSDASTPLLSLAAVLLSARAQQIVERRGDFMRLPPRVLQKCRAEVTALHARRRSPFAHTDLG